MGNNSVDSAYGSASLRDASSACSSSLSNVSELEYDPISTKDQLKVSCSLLMVMIDDN